MEELEKIYEDEEIEVFAAPDDAELEQLLLNILKEKPMKFKELKEVFSATAGEDRLRRALTKLIDEGLVQELENGTYTARPEGVGPEEASIPDELEEELAELEEEELPTEEEELEFEEIEEIEDIDEELDEL
jgi:acylphosphatase